MKRLYLYIFIALLFSNCEENSIGISSPINTEPSNVEVAVNKKGVAFTNKKEAWSHKTSDLKAHWMYSWGNVFRDEIPENVEFVPMFWGRNSVNDDNINRIKGLVAEGKVKYVLGFNEPDGESQANMTVDEAIELWPRLEEIGVPLGSPATVSPENDWMMEFMRRADAEGLRIDFIAVHHYGGNSATSLISKLNRAYQNFGERPIWITEFAVADWNASSPANNRYSSAEVIDFMEQLLPALDNIEWLHRYAWFSGTNAPLISSALFTDDNEITDVGIFYANHSPNSIIGPGIDTEFEPVANPDELVQNPGFETGTISPWGGFKNGILGSGGVIEPFAGGFSGRIENGDGSLFTVVSVEAGQSYRLSYYSRWLEQAPQPFTPTIRNNDGNALLFRTDETPVSIDWVQTTYDFTIPDGVSDIRVVFFKANGFPPFFLDDVSIKKVD